MQVTNQWQHIKKELEFLGRYLSKRHLCQAITILSDSRKSRFLRRKTPKYGSMQKGFREEELKKFFSVIDDPKLHLLFSFQAILGLRIGEAARVNIKDINLRTRELRIFTEKARVTDYLIIPIPLFEQVIKYVNAYEKEIAECKGFLFFSLVPGRRTKNTEPHLTTHTIRDAFRKYLESAGLDEVYGYSAAEKPKALQRLSSHSLRHYAITNFCKKNGGNAVLASKFARHSNMQTTMIYIHTEKAELYESIERANDERLIRKVKKMQERV